MVLRFDRFIRTYKPKEATDKRQSVLGFALCNSQLASFGGPPFQRLLVNDIIPRLIESFARCEHIFIRELKFLEKEFVPSTPASFLLESFLVFPSRSEQQRVRLSVGKGLYF